jgi:xanthine/CO dehydrogenase XdhC/CoxF family maturation factor
VQREPARLVSAVAPCPFGLRAPVGLDLGGRTLEAIALSIVAEAQAVLHERRGAPLSAHLGQPNPKDT